MRIVFVYYAYENQGSELDLEAYARAARDAGHECVVYGRPQPRIPLPYTKDLRDTDAIVFVVEWTTGLQDGDQIDWVRLLSAVPRSRRVLIDCDGRYNDALRVHGDYNHRDEAESRYWTGVCDGIADKIFQPTPRPLRSNVGSFLFHVYDPDWEAPIETAGKEFGMVYVGHSKFRWHGMSQVLRAIEPVRDEVGRIALFGHGWDGQPHWAAEMGIEDIYQTDPDYLKSLGVEAMAPVSFSEVIRTVRRGVFNPVVYRPLFERLGMVTCRTFETIAAGTIPLFLLDRDYVREVFGERALELMLDTDATERIRDVMRRPHAYADIVHGIRREFRVRHSPAARLQELIRIIES